MDRDEQVGIVPVGNIRSFKKFNKNIFIPGVDHFNILEVGSDQFPEFQGYAQVDVFFL